MSETKGKTVMVVGRIVWTGGDLFKGKVKTEFGKQTPKLNQQGQQQIEYSFGLAVPKTALTEGGAGYALWAAIWEETYALYPTRQVPPAFSQKYKDGDGVDDKGIPFSQREGYAGHLVFALSTQLPITFFRYENGQNIQVNDGIKCGDYVTVQLQVKAHPAIGQGKAGIYLNPTAVQLLREGKEIINRPSGDQIFGVQAPALPQGIDYQAPAAPTMLVPTGAPQAAPAPAFMPPPTQAAPATPHYGVVPPGLQPQGPMGIPQGQPMGGFQQPAAPQGFPPPVR